jgi:hypothetical protein
MHPMATKTGIDKRVYRSQRCFQNGFLGRFDIELAAGVTVGECNSFRMIDHRNFPATETETVFSTSPAPPDGVTDTESFADFMRRALYDETSGYYYSKALEIPPGPGWRFLYQRQRRPLFRPASRLLGRKPLGIDGKTRIICHRRTRSPLRFSSA